MALHVGRERDSAKVWLLEYGECYDDVPLWGEVRLPLVRRPGIGRVLGISARSRNSHGDLVKLEPVAGELERHRQEIIRRRLAARIGTPSSRYTDWSAIVCYQPCEWVFRASRRVELSTYGTPPARLCEVAQYLAGWPTAPGYTSLTTCDPTSGASWIMSEIMPDGFPAGITAGVFGQHPPPFDVTSWRVAFPWPTRRRDAVAFLDACPHVTWHGLRKDEHYR